jgi:gamma-glutamyltranspeptidase / glutathione hydrolase
MRSFVAGALVVVLLAASPAGSGRSVAVGHHAMVATEQHDATQVGLDILRAGGNAVDAAVAVAYALAVVDPCCGNIGGGGFMLVRMHDGRESFINFRERAPAAATRDMYLDASGNAVPQRSRKGWLAVGVPGTVAGMEAAREKFGTMTRAQLLAPAIALAHDGFEIQPGDLIPFEGSAGEGPSGASAFSSWPNVRAIFTPQGRFPRAGERMVQPQLAHTLQTISAGGADAFYRGPVAAAVVAASRAHGGILSLADFASYRVEETAPLHCSYRGYDIASAPPPSSGGIALCETLDILAPYPLAAWGWHSLRSVHYTTEAERHAFADRDVYLGDPDFITNPIAALLAPAYAARARASIAAERATPSVDVAPGLGPVPRSDDGDTTHYSIVDAAGNAVAVTYTINDWFGSGVIAGDTGFFLNDEMDDFTAKSGSPNMFGLVQGERNDVVARKRPLSSMAPTIVTKDGKLVMVTGSPGGPRIITTVLETILNALVYGMTAQQAVDAPRTHMQYLPDEITYEPGALDAATRRTLRANGYALHESSGWGSAQVVVVGPLDGTLYGGSDRRHPSGAAIGY